ncbi:MAG: hypothetical protein GF398_09645 [Chitinivibrionales bacterium]|nr:hypothetical protein [Chitinivibrionales bacterium]
MRNQLLHYEGQHVLFYSSTSNEHHKLESIHMNPATLLTLSRLLWGPLFAACFVTAFSSPATAMWLWLALAAAGLIELTDFLDGRIARARKEVTNFGKLVDPMSDSLSRTTIFLSFLLTDIIPLWMFLIFMYRDSFMATLRIMIAKSGTVQAAKMSGKLKAGLQAVGTFAVLGVCLASAYKIAAVPHRLWGFHPGFWIMLTPAAFTALSFFDYFVPAWPVVRSMMHSEPS